MSVRKKITVYRMVEDIVGCKWSLTVLDMVKRGINRPGAMTREQTALSSKVLNERLTKLTDYQILEKQVFAEVPPHVEYHFTEKGREFLKILTAIDNLQDRWQTDSRW